MAASHLVGDCLGVEGWEFVEQGGAILGKLALLHHRRASLTSSVEIAHDLACTESSAVQIRLCFLRCTEKHAREQHSLFCAFNCFAYSQSSDLQNLKSCTCGRVFHKCAPTSPLTLRHVVASRSVLPTVHPCLLPAASSTACAQKLVIAPGGSRSQGCLLQKRKRHRRLLSRTTWYLPS